MPGVSRCPIARGGNRNRSNATIDRTSSAAMALCAVASGSGKVLITMSGPTSSCVTSATASAMPAVRTPGDWPVRIAFHATKPTTSAATMAPMRCVK